MKKVYFLGHGYEVVKFVFVEAETNGEALDKAEEWYKSTGQTFDYVELEVARFI